MVETVNFQTHAGIIETLEEASVVVGVSGGFTEEDAVNRISTNHNIPADSLVAYEIAV